MDQTAQIALRFDDRAAVPRPVDRLGAPAQLVERGHVGAHRAVGRRDDRRRPGHHVIAGQQRVFLDQREAQMIGAMARRGDGFDREARALQSFAVGEDPIGRIVAVVGGIEAGRPIALGHERRGADHPRAGRRAEPVRAGAVIAMGMGDQDRLDFLALDRGEQRREMRSRPPGPDRRSRPRLGRRYRCRCR